jgi:hypothetical protein
MNIMSNNEPLMKLVFMKSDLITKRERERKTERKEAFGPMLINDIIKYFNEYNE